MVSVMENVVLHTKETERANRVAETMALLEQYGHTPTRYGLECVYNTHNANKKGLRDILSKHPKWNPEKEWVEVEIFVERPFDKEAVKDFIEWAKTEINKIFYEKRLKVGLFDGYEYQLHKEAYGDYRYRFVDGVKKVHGLTLDEVYKEIERMSQKLTEIGFYTNTYCNHRRVAFNREVYYAFSAVECIFDSLEYINSTTATGSFVSETNRRAEKLGLDLKAREGQKVSTIILKVAQAIGLDKVKDIQTVSYTSDNGEYHERKVDNGWNKQFAKFTDAIKPKSEKKVLRISNNLNDFLTMSFGNGWASCHTIDKANIRNGHHSYSGQYCSGTLSYALDETSLVVYIPADEEKWDKYTKEKRQMFFFGEGKLIQSLLYPDGRDGGIIDYNTAFRKAVQDVFAECLGYTDNWIKVEGSADRYIDTYGTHYPDYNHGCFNTVSFLKDENGNKNETAIEVGHNPICIETGNEHYSESELYDDEYSETCECCESRINTENYNYVRAVDSYGDYIYFCDSECANNRGYVYCLDDDDYRHEDSCYFDDYEQEHFYDDSEMVRTEDGNTYMNETNAENDGYVYCDDNGVWIPEDDAHYDEYDKEWFSDEYDMVEAISTSNGNLVYFRDEDNAVEYGATYNEEEERWEVA